MTKCKVETCTKRARSLGMCIMHYRRLKRHGDPLGGRGSFDGDLIAFIDATVAAPETDACVIWPFGTTKGYGRLKVDGVSTSAHRETCRRAHGAPPTPQHQAAHNCRNGQSGCINPNHLRWATPAENAADMIKDGTVMRGTKAPTNVLTDDQVLEIVAALGSVKQRVLAARYNVTESTISSIKKGRIWGWLTGITS